MISVFEDRLELNVQYVVNSTVSDKTMDKDKYKYKDEYLNTSTVILGASCY